MSSFFTQLFASERRQIALMAEEKLPAQISLRLFATGCSEMRIRMKKHKKVSDLHISFILMTVVPMVILGIVVCLFVYNRYTKIMYREVEKELRNTAYIVYNTYDFAYPGEYGSIGQQQVAIVKGEKVLNSDYSVIDKVSRQTESEITLFYKNVRVLTTISGASENSDSDERIVGTTARTLVVNEVKKDMKDHFYSNSKIGDKEYFAYYMPLKTELGLFCGMIGVAKPASDINRQVREGIFPIIAIILLAMLFMVYMSYKYCDALIRRINVIRKFLIKTEQGDFICTIAQNEIDKKDEISEMGRTAISMQKSLRKLVEQDALTGINNRRYGDRFLVETQKKCLESGMNFSVAIADIDHFKRVNDTYGHECGDKVLYEIASILKNGMLGKGFVARWGGEEFLLVFDKDNVDDAYKYLEVIMDSVREKEIIYGDVILKVTMTCGITEGTDDPIDTILKKADNKLYEGKQNGRNKIVK